MTLRFLLLRFPGVSETLSVLVYVRYPVIVRLKAEKRLLLAPSNPSPQLSPHQSRDFSHFLNPQRHQYTHVRIQSRSDTIAVTAPSPIQPTQGFF